MTRFMRFVLASIAVTLAFIITWLVGELVLDRETAQALGGLASAVVAGILFWWATLESGRDRRDSSTLPVRQVGLVPNAADNFRRRVVAEEIEAAFVMSGTVILTGMGGVGKTQIAADLARRVRTRGEVDVLVWISATTRDSIEAGLAHAGKELLGGDSHDLHGGAARFGAWLATTEQRWLVVFDDVSEPADLSGWWPPKRPRGRVVVTTRRRDAALAAQGRLVTVEPFQQGEAQEFLAGKLGDRLDQLDQAEGLAEDLGRLPLAMAQAAAFIMDRDLSCAAYRVLFADRHRNLGEVTPESGALPDEYHWPVGVTWALSVEAADRLNPAGLARPLLTLLSLLDPNGVPVDLLCTAAVTGYLAQYQSSATQAEGVSSNDVRGALAALSRLSLITVASDRTVVRTHALVQRAVREQAPHELLDAAASAVASALVDIWPEIEHDGGYSQLLRANTEMLRHWAEERIWSTKPELLLRFARSLGDTGLFIAARVQFEHLVAAATARLGHDHPHTLIARGGLAYWQLQTGNYADAAAAADELLADRLRILGPQHPETLAAHNLIATVHHLLFGQPVNPDDFDELLADRTRILGPDHPDTLTLRAAQAHLSAERGELAKAAALMQAVAADTARVLGQRHARTLVTQGLVAVLRAVQGEVTLTELEAILAEMTTTLGTHHPQVLIARGHLALLQARLGDRAKAKKALEALVADLRTVVGPNHPFAAIAHGHLLSVANEPTDAITGPVTPGDPWIVTSRYIPPVTQTR